MKYKIFLLLAVVTIFTTSLDSKEYIIQCTPILDGDRICFIEGTADGRIQFNIPCECDIDDPCTDLEQEELEFQDDLDYEEIYEQFMLNQNMTSARN